MHRPTLAFLAVIGAVTSLPFSTMAVKAEEAASPGLRAIVAGSTGGVGRRTLLLCCNQPTAATAATAATSQQTTCN